VLFQLALWFYTVNQSARTREVINNMHNTTHLTTKISLNTCFRERERFQTPNMAANTLEGSPLCTFL